MPDSHECSLGIGYLPLNKSAQRISESDVVLLLGVKLDYQLGFGGSPPFNKNAKIICRNSKTRSGAEVLIRWKNSYLKNL